jgi:hypothetical protein
LELAIMADKTLDASPASRFSRRVYVTIMDAVEYEHGFPVHIAGGGE